MRNKRNQKRRLSVQPLENRYLLASDLLMGPSLPEPVIASPPAEISMPVSVSSTSSPGGSTYLTEQLGSTSGPGGSTYLTEQLSGTAGPGGSTFLTEQIGGSANPGGDDV